jgi:nicotinamide-nucleotide adenylyltransferase/phosphinothricin biosynthesis protein PhpF
MSTIHEVAVVHGRFQPLHLGHLEYLLAGARRCTTLIVGITNPDPYQTAPEPTDPARGLPEANPFTYYERYLMVEASLEQVDVPRHRLRIVPFPHSYPQRLRYYVPVDAVHLLTVYDEWGEEKVARLRHLGMVTEVMWRRTDKPISGTRVRQAIAAGADWQPFVPPAVADIIKEHGIDARLRV